MRQSASHPCKHRARNGHPRFLDVEEIKIYRNAVGLQNSRFLRPSARSEGQSSRDRQMTLAVMGSTERTGYQDNQQTAI
jgi:hypothetical protein